MAMPVQASEPITRDWKINEVLKVHPELLDVLVSLNPTFRMLRNPVMRRVQSRLVTVAQAAQIGGMDPDELLGALNEAIGVVVPGAAPEQEQSRDWEPGAPPWVASAAIFTEVDVRPLQRQGIEPFSVIMAAAREVPYGHAFRLLNTFEPAPLYDVLAQRGFAHWAKQRGESDWEILFYNTGSPRMSGRENRAAVPAVNVPEEAGWESPSATITIDVSELVPPEPMIRILEALERLPDGASLLVHHVRRPMHLYPRLDELGFRHETRELGPNRVEVLIEKPATAEPGER